MSDDAATFACASAILAVCAYVFAIVFSNALPARVDFANASSSDLESPSSRTVVV
ncbi:MAG: hypothetical protein IPH07_23930 [Deltaproteobacteria bacterium]|nr:hypothetical protein [Deltaproteobacteria bacterium]